jgi:hypothetical protein
VVCVFKTNQAHVVVSSHIAEQERLRAFIYTQPSDCGIWGGGLRPGRDRRPPAVPCTQWSLVRRPHYLPSSFAAVTVVLSSLLCRITSMSASNNRALLTSHVFVDVLAVAVK